MSIKVVYNNRYGGFSLSDEAVAWLNQHGIETDTYSDLPRHHALLVKCVEELGVRANGDFASLAVKTLIGNKYRISEYDGSESVVEPSEDYWTVVNPEENDSK
jgi:hypothetical protein